MVETWEDAVTLTSILANNGKHLESIFLRLHSARSAVYSTLIMMKNVSTLQVLYDPIECVRGRAWSSIRALATRVYLASAGLHFAGTEYSYAQIELLFLSINGQVCGFLREIVLRK